ncbi:MAG TPA: SDR family oxidoreductase [Solirubrobacterales bacterium]|nr:SDR family oxidoreductase [Solirubrobacterales bacterium]
MKDFRGKRCFITGAASGIGRATAIAMAAEGADLYLTDVQAEALEEAVAEIRRAGGTVSWFQAADIAEHPAVVAMAAEIHAAHGSMDVVMNVAGIATWGRIEQLEHSDWQRTVEVDLLGPISVLECFVPPMIEAGRGGHVVNVSSAAGLFGLPWHAPYSAAKFGLRGVSEVLRFDLRRHRIGVSLVCPGAVKTPIVDSVKAVGLDRSDPGVEREVRRFLRHAVTPEQAAEKIVAGIERDRYMVFTSSDTRILHWIQRKFSPPYELAMRIANRRFDALAERP